ncbi:glycosyltransferase family 39 protein [Mucilaginibacter sp. 21P]|uniref:ArnT family glycosyltransferase n=1 Tax=Mucilaginibacter sp. 21P TaxID=2778902 RepID=UPI001C570091|nr:glycosyltransferase family 39 protein [Mucilaginibacter sp. 21P]QXV64871.1 glycosyltransferase family 39 protein [Mucilaginibacter sp. 21P]
MGTKRNSINFVIICFALAKLLMHFAANGNYGLHADELYYLALSNKPQWGYIDNGPFIVWMVKLSGFLFGESLFAWRLLPSLAGTAILILTGKMAERLGGGKPAVVAACMAVLCSPAFTATTYLLQPVIFDQFFWTAIAYCIISYNATKHTKYLYLAAACTGLGLLNKYSILLYLAFFVLPLILSIKQLRKPVNFFVCLAIITIIILPNVTWQINHGFPVFNYLNVVTHRHIYSSLGDFIFQLVFFHGAAMAVWLAGVAYLLTTKDCIKQYRVAGYGFLIMLPVLYLLNGKLYYIMGAFPFLMAIGGVCWEKMLVKAANAVKISLVSSLALVTLIALPVVLPILPLPMTKQYIGLMKNYTPITQPLVWEDGRIHPLPQYFSDMLSWQDMATKVIKAARRSGGHESIPVVYTESYAAAGAICYYSKKPLILVADANSFAQWSPITLPPRIIYISQENLKIVSSYADAVTRFNGITDDCASASQLHIYLLSGPSSRFTDRYRTNKSKFVADRKPLISEDIKLTAERLVY